MEIAKLQRSTVFLLLLSLLIFPLNASTKVSACGYLYTPNTVYELAQDVSEEGNTCFVPLADGITIDCKGKRIIGDNSDDTHGIYSEKKGTAIIGCTIEGFMNGITFNGVKDGRIEKTVVKTTRQNGRGVYFDGADGNIIVESNIHSDSNDAILFEKSSHNTISKTDTSSIDGYGIHSRFDCTGNKMVDVSGTSKYGMGISICTGSGNSELKNAVGISQYSYGLHFYLSENNMVEDSEGHSIESHGIYIDSIGKSLFKKITGTSVNDIGIHIDSSFSNTITGSEFHSESGNAAVLSLGSSENTFFRNKFISGGTESNLLKISSDSNGNVFYWNTFGETFGMYVDDGGGENRYYETVNGRLEGNLWHNVLSGSPAVYGLANSDYGQGYFVGYAGAGFPYTSSSSKGKVSAGVIDRAPLTKFKKKFRWPIAVEMYKEVMKKWPNLKTQSTISSVKPSEKNIIDGSTLITKKQLPATGTDDAIPLAPNKEIEKMPRAAIKPIEKKQPSETKKDDAIALPQKKIATPVKIQLPQKSSIITEKTKIKAPLPEAS